MRLFALLLCIVARCCAVPGDSIPGSAVAFSYPSIKVPHASHLKRKHGPGLVRARMTTPDGQLSAEQLEKLKKEVPPEKLAQAWQRKEQTDLLKGKLAGCSVYVVGASVETKSAVARLLARRLQYRFLDMPQIVEGCIGGKSEEDVAREEGEESLAELQAQVLDNLQAYTRCVISTSGATGSRTSDWSPMQQGVVLWLRGTDEDVGSTLKQADATAVIEPGAGVDDLVGALVGNILEEIKKNPPLHEGWKAKADAGGEEAA